ncbi:pirin family protein [Chryseobacterium shandongense]|uniref:Pirin family protein n=1 Tax=Chryseobacterium shandongense TaxID=1493872 RepID=A0AAD0YHT3_9FLAO|nr:pirin family protein [Chryseobacterium shandongense]AZA95235.1 pirin family protein [Chryseobacterium shandongense]
MAHKEIIKRAIQDKWPVTLHKDTEIHKAGLVLPPEKWELFDPFVVMAEDNMRKGAFDYHPHRGIETVTYVIGGILNHSDNLGNKGQLKGGDTQWMTAGKGLLHLEEAPEDGYAHILQLWVNLPANKKLVTPRYQDIVHHDLPVRYEDGAEIRVISGFSGTTKSPTANYVPVTMVEIILREGYSVKQDFPADYNGFIYIISGSGTFGADNREGNAREVLWLSPSEEFASEVSMTAITNLKLLVIAGRPLREPVVARGPFVMNTNEELDQAFKDYRDGKFGNWEDTGG